MKDVYAPGKSTGVYEFAKTRKMGRMGKYSEIGDRFSGGGASKIGGNLARGGQKEAVGSVGKALGKSRGGLGRSFERKIASIGKHGPSLGTYEYKRLSKKKVAFPLSPPPVAAKLTTKNHKAARTGPALPAVELKRDPKIIFHERVEEGVTNELIVTLEELTQANKDIEGQIAVVLAAGKESVVVNVILSAPGFVVTPAEARMTVKRKRDPKTERVRFELTANQSGDKPVRRVIHADFFLRNSLIGSVSHATFVVPRNYAGPESDGRSESDGFALPARPREDCEWVLIVVGDNPTYQVLLNSIIPNSTFVAKDMGKLQMPETDLAKYLNDILSAQFDAYPNERFMEPEDFKKAVGAWQQNFQVTVENLGMRLWQWLPQPLRDEYFKHYQAGTLPRSILIHSTEMIFPWELVIPNQVLDGKQVQLKPLGVGHILGRWKPGLTMKPPQQLLKVRKFCVLNPNYPPPDTLPWAQEEVSELKKLFPDLIVPVVPADLQKVREMFAESDVQVLHFSGHGEIDPTNPDLNKILLDNSEKFVALNLAGTKLCAEAQPFVYMNACSVGNVGVAVGRAGGFASNFVENGCSGVIAPFWPINDYRSMQFAIAFYGKLKLGRAVGEALQELREENQQDPTFHAYTYFGDPWARLALS